ncbi:MAG TPA: ABC transporter permease [Terriglobales bacterium]|jgi:macrolide transport system ATP-binding/permease protein|nr:ABC transporter permease [Terriglobales bacterium]
MMNFEWIGQDIRFGLRSMLRSPSFTVICILSLALGIGANTTIFTVINAVLLHPLPVAEISRLVQLDTVDSKTMVTQARATKMGMSYANCEDYQRQSQVFDGLSCNSGTALTWSGEAEPKQVAGQLVNANYFQVLGLTPAAGRFFLPDEDTKPGGNNVAILSYSLWANKFGSDRNLIGRSVTFNATPFTVIGVGPKGFKGTFTIGPADQVWVPVSMYGQVLAGFVKDNFRERRFLNTFTVARLKPGVSEGEAEASLKTIASQLAVEYPKENAGRSVAVSPLADAAVGINQHDQFVLAGALMMGVVGLILLIACANLANLLLAKGARREREMSIRTAVGASRVRLIRQLLTESLVLSLSGGAAGLLLAFAGRRLLWAFRPPFIENNDLDLELDSHVLLFTLGLALLTGIIFGLAPAIKASRADVSEALKAGGRGGSGTWTRGPLRSILIVSEVALALITLVGAGLFIRSMENAQRTDFGFESKRLFVMAVDLGALHYDEAHGQQFYRDAIQRVNASHMVQAAAVASNLPLGGGLERTVFPEGKDETSGYRGTLTQLNDVSPGFFDTLRIPLTKGRSFTDLDKNQTTPVAVINEAMARHFWPDQDAIGKRFHFFGDPKLLEVVGIVGNTVINQVGEDPQPLAYLPLTQDYPPAATVQVRTSGDPRAVIATVRSQIQGLDPNLAITNVQTVEDVLNQGLWAPRMAAALLTLFGGLALALAAIGVYGVLSYSVNQQTREIGIRMALGATPSGVLRWVVGQGLRLAGAGVLVGVVAGLGLMHFMGSLLFGVSTHDPETFGTVILVLGMIALLACYLPARRATKVNPLVALRQD